MPKEASMDLIQIKDNGGNPAVDARELHEFLEVGKVFGAWIQDRIQKYDFQEGVDFETRFPELESKIHGGQNRKEYTLSLDMAKEIAMLENNDKGRQARKYFIEVEKRYRDGGQKLTGMALISAAVIEAHKMIDQQAKQIEAMKPAAQFYADVAGSRDAMPMSQAAKIIGMGVGRNRLFAILRENGVLMANNEPYQKYIDLRWFRVVEQKYQAPDGEIHISVKTLVYQKGIEGIIKILREETKR